MHVFRAAVLVVQVAPARLKRIWETSLSPAYLYANEEIEQIRSANCNQQLDNSSEYAAYVQSRTCY